MLFSHFLSLWLAFLLVLSATRADDVIVTDANGFIEAMQNLVWNTNIIVQTSPGFTVDLATALVINKQVNVTIFASPGRLLLDCNNQLILALSIISSDSIIISGIDTTQC